MSVLYIYEVKGPLERSSCNVITVRFSCSDRVNIYISRKTVAAEVQAFVQYFPLERWYGFLEGLFVALTFGGYLVCIWSFVGLPWLDWFVVLLFVS